MRKTHSLSEVENSWVCVHSHQEDSRCPAASPLVLWHQRGCHLFWPQVPALSLCSVLSLKLPLRPLCPRKRLRLSRGPCLAPSSPSSGWRGQRDAAGWSSSPGLEWSCSRPVSWGHRKPLPLLAPLPVLSGRTPLWLREPFAVASGPRSRAPGQQREGVRSARRGLFRDGVSSARSGSGSQSIRAPGRGQQGRPGSGSDPSPAACRL